MSLAIFQHRQRQANTARMAAAVKSNVIPTQYSEVELQEHLCLVAFRTGTATADHWNELAECRNVLMYGAGHKRQEARRAGSDTSQWQAIIDLCYRTKDAMLQVMAREQKSGRFGLNAEQLEVISACVMTSASFWPQQPAWMFRQCVSAVRKLNSKIVNPKGNRK